MFAGWVAVIVQVLTEVKVTVVPLMVQAPLATYAIVALLGEVAMALKGVP
jgi:hypothetical protein